MSSAEIGTGALPYNSHGTTTLEVVSIAVISQFCYILLLVILTVYSQIFRSR